MVSTAEIKQAVENYRIAVAAATAAAEENGQALCAANSIEEAREIMANHEDIVQARVAACLEAINILRAYGLDSDDYDFDI